MLKSKKKDCVRDLEAIYKESSSVIVTHYHGLTVAQITNLRRSLRTNGASLKVVKNTLANIAAGNVGVAHDTNIYAGPTAIAYSVDPVVAAKCVVEFAKTNDNLKIVGGMVNNEVVDVSTIKHLATLPSLDELRGGLVGLLQAPATKIAKVLREPAAVVARVLGAYSSKNQ